MPAVYTETVLVAKEYLDGELAKYETWDTSNENIRGLFDNQRAFETTKGSGVGQTTILKFLGGNWKQWVVQDALNTIKEVKKQTISKAAINELPSAIHSKEFKRGVRKYKIPKGEQRTLAKQIKKDGVGQRGVVDHVKEHARITGRIPN